jgi:uncharacterized OB-fold protein
MVMSRKVWFVPELTPENTPFWSGGGQGKLLIMHCDRCDHAIHPPELICPRCLCREVSPRAARGTGSIYSVTVNYQKWFPEMEVPYAIAVVDLDGEAGVRITAQVVGTAPEDVAIGNRVRVLFEPAGDNIWIPQVELIR